MKRTRKKYASSGILVAIGCLMLVAPACTSRSSKANAEDRTERPAAAMANHGEHYFDGGTYCVQTFTQGPALAQPLHFSNREDQSDGSSKSFESDLSGDKLDVVMHQRHKATEDDKPSSTLAVDNGPIHVPARTTTVADGYAELVQTSHYLRSDDHEWSMGTSVLAQGGTPWSLFIFKPPVTQVGSENVNGYETIKYTIDTTHESALQKSAGMLRQLKDYNITGTAWVLKDGSCVLQYDINDEQVGSDGKTETTHYQGTVTTK